VSAERNVSERLPEYVLGLLPPAESAEIDLLVGASPALQREVAEISEALASTVAPLAPPPALRERVLGSLGSAERFRPFFAELTRRLDLAVDKVREVLARIDDPDAWGPSPLPWIKLIHFSAGPAAAVADAGFVRVEAGAAFPRHRHLGHETTIVLEGQMRDGDRLYGPGEVVEWDTDTIHEYSAGPERSLVLCAAHNGIEPTDPSIPKYEK
jgi:quercetin dioxygenase-like cupin family protein